MAAIKQSWCVVLLTGLLAGCGAAPAQPADPPAVAVVDSESFQKHVAPFLKKHCVSCHGAEKPKGGVRLDTLAPDVVNAPHAAVWVEVMDRLNLGEMPPKEQPRPDANELSAVTRWIAAELRGGSARAQSSGGRVPLRRLNRAEYLNTVRDLLQVVFDPGEGPDEMLPPDGQIAGFDTVGKALPLDASLMEAYFRAAEVVAERAIGARPPRVPTHRLRFEFEDTPRQPTIAYIAQRRSTEFTPTGMIIMDMEAGTSFEHPSGKQIPVRGRYTVRIRAGADAGDRKEPVYMDVSRAEGVVAKFKVDAPLEKPQVYEFTRVFDGRIDGGFAIFINGTRLNEINGEGHLLQEDVNKAVKEQRFADAGRIQARSRAAGQIDTYARGAVSEKYLDTARLPKLFLDYLEVEGPLYGPWPPRSRQTIFFDGLADDRKTLDYARAIFDRLLPRALRRPVAREETQTIVDLVAKEMGKGEPFEEAVKTGLIVMLCSPHFLYHVEPAIAMTEPPGKAPPKESSKEASRRLSDHELASRLSYFLWSSMPDDELTRLAGEGRLRDGKTLDVQVDRMLADPKSEALIDRFATQWLKVDEFARFAPNRQLYGSFHRNENAGLVEDMKQEPLAMVREILHKNDRVTSLLDADWTMANERLARWYGIAGVEGDHFRRVALPANSARGGLLGMAGVHLWGSDGNRTKPVHRGKYLLDVLFNDPPDPPPPNAGEVQPNVRGQHLTVRERLAQHRTNQACAGCHNRVDPYGLALENFNAVGQWRDVQDGETDGWGGAAPKIDPSGVLPSGKRFADFREFKSLIAGQNDRFVKALCQRLMIYSLGRTLEPGDRQTIEELVVESQRSGHVLRGLIKGIVKTGQFQSK